MSKLAKYAVTVLTVTTLLFTTIAPAESSSEPDNIRALMESVDRKHQLFSTHFQIYLASLRGETSTRHNEIASLSRQVDRLIDRGDNILAANLIFNNIEVLNKHYDGGNTSYFIKILLDQNDHKTARALSELIHQKGDQASISNTTYLFSVSAFQKNRWQETLRLLDEIVNDLPDEERHHALLMQGISQQKLNRHRKSIAYYEQITPTSTYYLSAQLNKAIANIRQSWWTDAHRIIHSTLKSAKALKEEETINRLYLTLGYSLMNQEYYRDSRRYFRNIGIESIHANQALLGITLTAANQNDFVGALNTAHILKNRQTYALPVDESYLLMPYFYEKLRQLTTASAGYLEAINYYQKRVAEIETIIRSEINLENHPIEIGINTTLEIEGNPINFSLEYPDYFFKNYLTLKSYKKHLKNTDNQNIKAEYEQLNSEYKKVIVSSIRNLLKQRIKQLNSYMGQSRFGLARLYDSNLTND